MRWGEATVRLTTVVAAAALSVRGVHGEEWAAASALQVEDAGLEAASALLSGVVPGDVDLKREMQGYGAGETVVAHAAHSSVEQQEEKAEDEQAHLAQEEALAEEELAEAGARIMEQADLVEREKPLFANRATPPLLGKGAAQVVADLGQAPGKVTVETKSGRVFYTAHPMDPTSGPGQARVLEWLPEERTSAPFPAQHVQEELGLRTVSALCMDNVRGWLILVESDPFYGDVASRVIVLDTSNSSAVVKVFDLPAAVAERATLTDVVIDKRSRFLFLADSSAVKGTPAVVVVDVHVWSAWRVLEGHASVEGKEVLPMLNGRDPVDFPWRFGVSALSLDATRTRLLYSAPFGDVVYSVPLKALTREPRPEWTPEQRRDNFVAVAEAQVEALGPKTVAGAMLVDPATGVVYVADFEHSAISAIEPDEMWSVTTLALDEDLLLWPNGLAITNDGFLLVACSALDRIMRGDEEGPFRLVRIPLLGHAAPAHEEL